MENNVKFFVTGLCVISLILRRPLQIWYDRCFSLNPVGIYLFKVKIYPKLMTQQQRQCCHSSVSVFFRGLIQKEKADIVGDKGANISIVVKKIVA